MHVHPKERLHAPSPLRPVRFCFRASLSSPSKPVRGPAPVPSASREDHSLRWSQCRGEGASRHTWVVRGPENKGWDVWMVEGCAWLRDAQMAEDVRMAERCTDG